MWLLKLMKSTEPVFFLLWLLRRLKSREVVFFFSCLLGTVWLLKLLRGATATAAPLLDPRGVMAFASDCGYWGY